VRERLPMTLARYLASGVTAVLDVGGPFWIFEARERSKTMPYAPQLAVTGPLISSHMPSELRVADPPILEVNAIDGGHVVPGSYLLVESLDRLSRADVLTIALPQFTSIINKGIIIVTLRDKKIYSSESIKKHPIDLIMSILIMIRANEESDTKADRVGKAPEQ
jgi:hypothetical protein